MKFVLCAGKKAMKNMLFKTVNVLSVVTFFTLGQKMTVENVLFAEEPDPGHIFGNRISVLSAVKKERASED